MSREAQMNKYLGIEDWNSTSNKYLNINQPKKYFGIVHNPENDLTIPTAQVYVPELHGKMSEAEKNELDYYVVSLGGMGTGGDTTGHTLQAGQKVEIQQDQNDYTSYKIISKLPFHEPKSTGIGGPASGGSASSSSSLGVNPNTVTRLEMDGKNAMDDYKNHSLLEEPLNRLATTALNILQNTIFSKFNQARTKIKVLGTALSTISAIPFPDVATAIDNIGNPAPDPDNPCSHPTGYCDPTISCGNGTPLNPAIDAGHIDLTNDPSRYCDCSGGNIGQCNTMVFVDGWKAKTKEWDFNVLTSPQGITINDNAEIIVPPGLDSGSYTLNCRMVNKELSTYFDDDNTSPGDQATIYEYFEGKHQQLFDITCKVVKDMTKVDFSSGQCYIDSIEMPRVGPKYISTLMPEIKFEMDPKITDKATFGQLHVISGPGDLTPSIEIDFTTTELKVGVSNKKR